MTAQNLFEESRIDVNYSITAYSNLLIKAVLLL